MTAIEYISQQGPERQSLMTAIHEAIIANDPSITPVVKPMMGKEMILYEERCYMKYGLASVKNYMSVHCLPMYMNPTVYDKYVKLAPAARFQKGCVNFVHADELPVAVVTELVKDCAKISIADMLENRNKKKKQA